MALQGIRPYSFPANARPFTRKVLMNIPVESSFDPAASDQVSKTLDAVTARLCRQSPEMGVPALGKAMPSPAILQELMSRLRIALFPAHFGKTPFSQSSFRYHMAAGLDIAYQLLCRQIVAGLCFDCQEDKNPCASCEDRGREAALAFMKQLPDIRALLEGDAKAAYEGDPAAHSPDETIFCYPSLLAMTHHRIAHALYRLNIPLIPRMIAEMAHSATGIDIHPGASIGEDFFIDHGTGVVIGETCIIGRSCRLYQGVTLGAHSFPKNPDGSLTKGIARHPVLEDRVTVYAGATILGRIVIGAGAIIGGNVWITENVPANAKILQSKP